MTAASLAGGGMLSLALMVCVEGTLWARLCARAKTQTGRSWPSRDGSWALNIGIRRRAALSGRQPAGELSSR